MAMVNVVTIAASLGGLVA